MAQPATNPRARIRLVIADIDGTLVTREKLLTPRAMEAVQRLDEAGILLYAKRELREVIRPAGVAIKRVQELVGRHHIRGISHMT